MYLMDQHPYTHMAQGAADYPPWTATCVEGSQAVTALEGLVGGQLGGAACRRVSAASANPQ
jgi:hypothetical protein